MKHQDRSIPGQKIHLTSFKKYRSYRIVMDSNGTQREINKEVTEKYSSLWRLNNMLQNNICANEEI